MIAFGAILSGSTWLFGARLLSFYVVLLMRLVKSSEKGATLSFFVQLSWSSIRGLTVSVEVREVTCGKFRSCSIYWDAGTLSYNLSEEKMAVKRFCVQFIRTVVFFRSQFFALVIRVQFLSLTNE